MREPQRLERNYHGHLIVSIQSTEPHPDGDGDGWDHEVFDQAGKSIGVFDSLGTAIQCAKRAKYPGKYTSTEDIQIEIEEIIPEPDEPETDTPETEETE